MAGCSRGQALPGVRATSDSRVPLLLRTGPRTRSPSHTALGAPRKLSLWAGNSPRIAVLLRRECLAGRRSAALSTGPLRLLRPSASLPRATRWLPESCLRNGGTRAARLTPLDSSLGLAALRDFVSCGATPTCAWWSPAPLRALRFLRYSLLRLSLVRLLGLGYESLPSAHGVVTDGNVAHAPGAVPRVIQRPVASLHNHESKLCYTSMP